MNETNEALDGDLRASIAASLPNPVIEYIDPPERTEPATSPHWKTKYEPHWNDAGTHVIWEAKEADEAPAIEHTNPPEQAKLNRAERRRLLRTVTRKARREAHKATLRQSLAIRELRGKRCTRCNLLFIGRAKWRCQCKAVPANKGKAEVAGNA